MKNKIFILVVVLLAVGSFLVLNSRKDQGVSQPVAKAISAETFVRFHSPTYGNPLSRVTVVEWFDPECESCRVIHPIFKKIISEYQGRVHFALRYMPYHNNSTFAAAALEEAREFKKYDEALDVLFEKQPLWGSHHDPRPELIVEYLSQLGIPKEKLEKNYLLEKHSEKIKIDEADGKTVGVNGTPTFFVNGVMLQQLGERPLREAIEASLKED